MDQKKDGRQGQNLGAEMKGLLESYKKELESLKAKQTELVDCRFCGGDGKEKRADGGFLTDANCSPLPCRVCRGKGKVRV
jgi:DnaJ-class molecular chaperone